MKTLEDLPDLATTSDLAEFTRLSAATLARWRVEGVGPRVTYLGRAVRYARADIEDWLAKSTEKRSA